MNNKLELSIPVLEIQKEIDELSKSKKPLNENGLFIIQNGNSWIEGAKARPIPKMLFGEFWFEGELCILFADTNLGKSILGVQIGDSISSGKSIPGFRLEAEKQRVLYFDFELSDKQFENRYSNNYNGHYRWDDNFLRVEMNSDTELPQGIAYEDYIQSELEKSIQTSGVKTLIIDNITYLKHDNEKAKDALPLMKLLKELKKKYNLSILALAHTPKRDLTKPITRNDLQGSKMLMNFCDSSFAVGESHNDKNIRYLKQIKSRNTEIIYDTENVCICNIVKPDNFLHFEFLNFGNEQEHLRLKSDSEKEDLMGKVQSMKEKGHSLREIGSELGISHMGVKRLIDKNNERNKL